ncbi:MAG: hypothetical protein L6R39_001032 [Caloplaca ligustica]|nr:MAG: hypothetical protein L6R39_001032 [Caloplaca ligustica]
MGDSLVESIPVDPEEYKAWLEALRERFAQWDALLQKFLAIDPEHLRIIESDRAMVEALDEAFDARLEGFPTYYPGSLDLFIEFTYTFDLDLEVFSVDNTAHFRLQNIPRNSAWMGALCQDQTHRRFVHPRLAPEHSLASLAVDNRTLSPNDIQYWETLTTKQVTPKAECANVSARLRLRLFDIFEDSQMSSLRVTLLSWTADDLIFRELAFFILCLAAGGDNLAIVDWRRILNSLWTELYGTVVHGHGSEGERELISSVGSGFHLQDLPVGSAPATSKYWFEGALVCLVPRLAQAGIMEKALADAVRYGRDECGYASFNAVLISIADVVFLRSFPDGSVEHSLRMPLIATSGSSGLDARQRYGDSELDTFYDQEMTRTAAKAEAEMQDAQKSSNDTGSTTPQNRNGSNQGIHGTNEGEYLPCTSESTQEAIQQSDADVATLLDASAISPQECTGAATAGVNVAGFEGDEHDGTMSEPANTEDRVGPPKRPETPADEPQIYEYTEENAGIALDDDENNEHTDGEGKEEVTPEVKITEVDTAEPDEEIELEGWETGTTFLSLISFFDATALDTLKPTDGGGEPELPPEIIEMILGYISDVKTHNACAKVSRAFRSFCLQRPLLMDGVRVLRSLPKSKNKADRGLRLLAEKATGQQLGVTVRKAPHYANDASCYLFVVGKQWNRRSFCLGTQLTIDDLDLPAPFETAILRSRQSRDQWRDGYRPSPEDSAWDQARGRYEATANSDIRSLSQYWEYVTALLFPDQGGRGMSRSVIQEPHDKDWLMPANTKQYSIETDYYRCKKYERFLLLRVKRASRYWDCLWEDIVGEMKELLARVDDNHYLGKRKKPQLVGAANPAVILVVGLETRLFTWNAEDAILTETIPGRVYSVMDVEDRKSIEAVLTSAVTRLQQAKRKKKLGFHSEESENDDNDGNDGNDGGNNME